MKGKIKLSTILLLLVLSVVTVFAQTGDNAEEPEEKQPVSDKTIENVTLHYEISPVPMIYLFTSKTEVNAKIENLNDDTKNKDIVGTINSSTSLKLTSEDLSVENFKIKVVIDKISGAYDIDGESAEFSLTKDGMKTKVDGEEGASIKELSDWNKTNPDSIGKTIAEFTLAKTGKISEAQSYTSAGEMAGSGTMGNDTFQKSLIYLQNPLILMNMLFWELPEDKIEFERKGNIPVKPEPKWMSKINYPFENANEFESVDSECSIVSVIEEKPEKTESEESEKKPVQKTIRIHRTIKHPTEKDTQIVAYMDYDVVKRVPVLVTFDIYKTSELNPTEDRKITITQKTSFRFVLQK